MSEIRQFLGYTAVLIILMIALKLSFDAIAFEAAGYVPASLASRPVSPQGSASEPAIREASANPVWIVPTPKYQYDPKLMEVKPLHERRKEAELRRQLMQSQFQAKQRDAKQREARRHKSIAEAAQRALASAREHQSPAFLPSFLTFSPH